ncbi:hypothetical protein AVEN_102660-1 [Araneus ventricosus]|uniref:Uncharacterized protein n=1 Tax=Araneus ventricosus TaxID=182803 RepID=A0A4Y2HYK4_ARAVE|nr:hypothetical protein AVEN_102660-1 [Araneus ventricosus]
MTPCPALGDYIRRALGSRSRDRLWSANPFLEFYPLRELKGRKIEDSLSQIDGTLWNTIKDRKFCSSFISIVLNANIAAMQNKSRQILSDAVLTKNVDATGESSVRSLVHRDKVRYPSATQLCLGTTGYNTKKRASPVQNWTFRRPVVVLGDNGTDYQKTGLSPSERDISASRSCAWGQRDRLPKNGPVPFRTGIFRLPVTVLGDNGTDYQKTGLCPSERDISASRSCAWGQRDRLPENGPVPFRTGHMVTLYITEVITLRFRNMPSVKTSRRV